MAIKHGLLAILNEGAAHGYHLKTEFEARTGNTWPLNIGQVYTTLARCERDGLVVNTGADEEGRVGYKLTAAGRADVREWFEAPVARESSRRDELAIKLALAISAPGVDVARIVQLQRTETMRNLQELTRLKVDIDDEAEIAWVLVLERHIFEAEAEARWLDHCEAKLHRTQSRPRKAAAIPARKESQVRGGAR